MKKRLFSLLLTAALCLTLLPTAAWAEEAESVTSDSVYQSDTPISEAPPLSVDDSTGPDGDVIADGKISAQETCMHENSIYIDNRDGTHHEYCSSCGYTGPSITCDTNVVAHDRYTDDGHYLKCSYCGAESATLANHDLVTAPTDDGKAHTLRCNDCAYTSGEPVAHTYDKNGKCTVCHFKPVAKDDAGNLYDSLQTAFETVSDGGTITLTADITPSENITFGEYYDDETGGWVKPGYSVTLVMDGHTLYSTSGDPALNVAGGTLTVADAATITAKDESSAAAIKVENGTLTFRGAVNATGGSGSSSAAPAIEVTGGKVTFEGDVTATGGLKTPGGAGNLAYCQPAVYATGGELDFKGDLDLNGGLTITGSATLTNKLTQGTFRVEYNEALSTRRAVSAVGSSVYNENVNNLLADNHIFKNLDSSDQNNKYFIASYEYLSWNVTIVEHEHKFDANNGYTCICGVTCDHSKGYQDGKCITCDKPCPHEIADQSSTDHLYYCNKCKQQMFVMNSIGTRGEQDFKYAFFTNLKDAMASAGDGWTVKLLDNVDNTNKRACVIGDGKTVTLNLNGHTVKEGWIQAGYENWNDQTSSTLKIVGSGSFINTGTYGNLAVGYKATLDLSGWTGDTISRVNLSESGNDESTLIVSENTGTINNLSFNGRSSETILSKLSGGSYGEIYIAQTDRPGGANWYVPFSSMLAAGYAFQYTDGTFVDYAAKAEYESTGRHSIFNVKVVKCTNHVDADGNKLCDYCNTNLNESVVATLETGGKTYYCTDLPSALDKANKANDTVTITLQKNVTDLGQAFTLGNTSNWKENITLDLNGKTLSGTGGDYNTFLTVDTYGTVTICDSGTTGQIKNTKSGGNYAVYVSTGKLIIEGGTFKGTDNTAYDIKGYALAVGQGAALNITGGSFSSPVAVYGGIVKISGGTFSGINAVGREVSTLLADGCGFKTTGENGSWLTSDALSKTTADNVTAVKAPIKFTITVTPDTTVEYGQPVDLNVKYDWSASEAESVTNEWYSVAENGMTGEKIAAATRCTVTPTVGTHTYRLIVTANGYTVSRDVTITINRRDLSNATVVPVVPVYNGQQRTPTVSQVSVYINYYTSVDLVEDKDYTVDVTPQTDAGTYDLTIKGKGNYTGEKTVSWNIFPREVTNPTVTLEYSSHVYTGEELQPTVTVKDSETVIPENEYTVSYENNTNAGTAAVTVTNKAGGNYTLGAASMSFQITKADAAVTAAPKANTLTYNGTEQPLVTAGTPSGGTMYYSLAENGEYAASIPTGKNAASYTVWYKVVGDVNHNDTAPQSVNVTVGKAPVTVTAQNKTAYTGDAAPDLSAPVRDTDYTVSGLFGADTLEGAVTLTYDGTPDLTKAGSTAIQISGTLANDNYTVAYVNGALTVTNRPSSGGGGGGGGSSSGSATTKTETTTNSDGSVTKTETKPDGTVIQTTTAKDGSTTRTETKPDGSSITQRTTADGSTGTVKTDANGNTRAEAKLSDKAVKAGKKSGEAVPVPAEVKAGESSNSAPTVKVELPKDAGETKIEIPVENVSAGAVAVIVHEDGTEELVKDSLPTETGVQLTVEGTTTVKILDHSKDFADTKDHWAKDAIDFVSARGLVSGVSGTTYAPDAPATRAQLWTILARWNNADLTGGATWYEKAQTWSKTNGISDGANPNGVITRAQMVTMLWRTAGSPESKTPGSFTDVAANSYYTQAVAWAVEHGITSGVGSGRFDPNAACTRAQIAAFLMRCYQSK